jgi:hypothetical protein
MPHINEMFPKPHITPDLLNKPYELVIKAVEQKELRPNQTQVTRWIIRFEKTEKYLILNKTNASAIAGLYGPYTEQWIGKRIVLYATQARIRGELQDVIRIRGPQANLILDQDNSNSE